MKNDISDINAIRSLVDSFYDKVRKDTLLAPIFNNVIGEKWPEHLAKMYRFWQTVLLDQHTYEGSPFVPHSRLPISEEHFERWLHLFRETVDELFEGEKAIRAKWQGERMAEMFLSKLRYYKENPAIPIL